CDTPTMHYPVRFRATVHLRSAEDGGRKQPIATGYRPAFWVQLAEAPEGHGFTDASIELVECNAVNPGASAVALLRPFREDQWAYLDVGDTVEFYEGSRLVGSA